MYMGKTDNSKLYIPPFIVVCSDDIQYQLLFIIPLYKYFLCKITTNKHAILST